MRPPNATRCSNTGHYIHPRWTSPCCYAEMDQSSEGTYPCPECGRQVELTVEQVPDYVAELVGIEEGDEE